MSIDIVNSEGTRYRVQALQAGFMTSRYDYFDGLRFLKSLSQSSIEKIHRTFFGVGKPIDSMTSGKGLKRSFFGSRYDAATGMMGREREILTALIYERLVAEKNPYSLKELSLRHAQLRHHVSFHLQQLLCEYRAKGGTANGSNSGHILLDQANVAVTQDWVSLAHHTMLFHKRSLVSLSASSCGENTESGLELNTLQKHFVKALGFDIKGVTSLHLEQVFSFIEKIDTDATLRTTMAQLIREHCLPKGQLSLQGSVFSQNRVTTSKNVLATLLLSAIAPDQALRNHSNVQWLARVKKVGRILVDFVQAQEALQGELEKQRENYEAPSLDDLEYEWVDVAS
ncbi:hypothetical protein [Marinibactrum halimedae]|uniref:Uncharacterized protein n=1 Tax=Marinibactrum halimedae TaxID=1444977 RepID=A0AA37WQ49_9GAMM|nr:hypothetical protein [Marinibactrum halimedae]MCD9458025.1 hypothetical protein [Marinibactrum halimedae]GLS27651.1 hypothetical protein GCM10007877_33700 [Marinibactrum halimedae]